MEDSVGRDERRHDGKEGTRQQVPVMGVCNEEHVVLSKVTSHAVLVFHFSEKKRRQEQRRSYEGREREKRERERKEKRREEKRREERRGVEWSGVEWSGVEWSGEMRDER